MRVKVHRDSTPTKNSFVGARAEPYRRSLRFGARCYPKRTCSRKVPAWTMPGYQHRCKYAEF